MVKISRDDVLKLASLSKLQLGEDEIDNMVKEISEIMNYVEKINTVEANELEPTDQVTGLKNVTRPDEIINYDASTKQLLKNAPATEKNQIKVKRILN